MGKVRKSRKSSSIGKWLWTIIITVLILWIAEQVLLKPVIETVATKVVGAKVTMGTFSLNILTHRVLITDLQIYNEEGFPPKVFFNADEIYIGIDPIAAMQGVWHFPLVIFRLSKMIVYKNARGKLNIDELKIVQEKMHDKNKGPMPNFKIDELRLNIAQVVVEDDSKSPALIEVYDLNLKNKTIRNVNSVQKLVGVILFEVLEPTAIQSAGLYAATTLLGIAFLPGLAIGVAIAKDNAVDELSGSVDQVFQQNLDLIQRLQGHIKKTDAPTGRIWAKVYDCDITIQIQSSGWGRSKINIKARKYFFAKPEIAAGLLYQLKGGS